MKVTVGILLITYKGAADEQPIRWVRLDDFERLERFIAGQVTLDQDLQKIRAEVARLRSQGVTDAQFKSAGIDLNKLQSTEATLPLRSYVITTKCGRRWIDSNRAHMLQFNNIASVRLVRRQEVYE